MVEKKKVVTVSINPPPGDKRCECCGRHVSELKPFGGAGDPLVGDFKGASLIKTFRAMAPRGLLNKFDISKCLDNSGFLKEELFIEKYGNDALEEFWIADQMESTVGASWECRDCAILGEVDYFKKLEERRRRNEQN